MRKTIDYGNGFYVVHPSLQDVLRFYLWKIGHYLIGLSKKDW